ncbi:hypothetical protein [Rouxiella badensis]|jgi:hypothetical protein|uniref:Fumarase D n=1 Tax=Rouxiella badensis TaxID=1646377 RepID=A0A1X0WDL9_9GAMM|nr:hypothetical protein [Rouxiella badensis]MCC3703167.1 hypothetical protein [Rouxiella badensis]MCC3720654.1 hypothetical protein [Rouxiella badensis]MCC3730476.1 hypothetical protein [Rouxiella badensis]MCC3734687.1 hypothetical protein [Rouxiella badensis]MCC3741791.1 hypothetical protein [Rouxiella badensis]
MSEIDDDPAYRGACQMIGEMALALAVEGVVQNKLEMLSRFRAKLRHSHRWPHSYRASLKLAIKLLEYPDYEMEGICGNVLK